MPATLLRQDIETLDATNLAAKLRAIRGSRVVNLEDGYRWNAKQGRSVPDGWTRLRFRGTPTFENRAKILVNASGLASEDQHADHDHDDCIAAAAKIGVPAAWAHTPETYLSM